ncbi:MAG: hypothetical protein ABMA64_30965, partial [Myxococcota bacterium]
PPRAEPVAAPSSAPPVAPPPPPPPPPPTLRSARVEAATVDVAFGSAVTRVPWLADERTAAIVLRALAVAGGPPVDPTGRALAGFRAIGDPASPVPPGATIRVERIPAETRLVDIVVRGEPEIRFRTPVSLVVPVGAFVAGLRDWLPLPDAPLVASVEGRVVASELLLTDALQQHARLVIGPP